MQPQKKIADIAGKMQQRGILNQQGTTRMIWDTLPVQTGSKYYRFFEGVNTRTQPQTNLTDNKLEAGESLACQFVYINILQFLKTKSEYTIVQPTVEIYLGSLSMELMNTIVMKPIRILSFATDFNRMPNANSGVYKLFTNQVIMPLTPFVFPLYVPYDLKAIADTDLYIQLTVEGTGSILSPRGTL
jgi:hypothetical protein